MGDGLEAIHAHRTFLSRILRDHMEDCCDDVASGLGPNVIWEVQFSLVVGELVHCDNLVLV